MWWWMQKIESACLRRSHWWSVHPGLVTVAVDIGVAMLLEEDLTFCQRRWHLRKRFLKNVSSGRHARWLGELFCEPATQPACSSSGVLGQPLPRATSNILGWKGFASTCRYMRHEWFGCHAQLQGMRELCQSQSKSLRPEKDERIC